LARSASTEWRARRLPVVAFMQHVAGTDYRRQQRVFAEIDAGVTSHPGFQQLLRQLAAIVGELHPEADKLVMTAHQVQTVARRGQWGDNAPEGTHQDGADYVVSAIEVEQSAARGATSIVYAPDRKTRYLTIDLAAGEGVFHADRGSPLWHDVTPLIRDPR